MIGAFNFAFLLSDFDYPANATIIPFVLGGLHGLFFLRYLSCSAAEVEVLVVLIIVHCFLES